MLRWTPFGVFPVVLRTNPVIATEYGPASVSRRRLGNLAVFLVVGSIAAAAGYVPWEVPALLLPWIAAVWLAGHFMWRAASPRISQWIETVSYCLDALWLTAVCFFLGGADWIASAFYVLLVITAAASLPMSKAAFVAAVAWLGFAWLSLGEAGGSLRLPAFGADAVNPSVSFAVFTVVIQGTTLALALLLQQALLGALRRSEERHRAILGAASDMVVVLDQHGVIQGASEVFAERTAFPVRGLIGSKFSDIVDARYRDRWTKELRTATTGEQATFHVAYRSAHANQGWISGTLVPLPPENGEERVLMIARDVSAEPRMASSA